ncbi:MAG: hypothetical protein HY822_25660 [Acidobacteria bacterium]|nr:hypothetical protein [Acidobacteriota bacterium]
MDDSKTLETDAVLAMSGVGKELWTEESGDVFIARLRDEWTADGTVKTFAEGAESERGV